MRKQYHFRPSENGLQAWDIDRLVVLSKHFPVIDVRVIDIRELDEIYWFSSNEDKPTCRKISEHFKLIQEVDITFPIIQFSDGSIVDGMHRVCRGLMEGVPTIKAVCFSVNPKPYYVGIDPNELPY